MHRLGHRVAKDERAVRHAPFPVSLFEPVEIARRCADAAVLEALQDQHIGFHKGAAARLELDQHVGIEVHRVILRLVQLRDMRQERVRRSLEEAVIVERVVVVEPTRELQSCRSTARAKRLRQSSMAVRASSYSRKLAKITPWS